MSATIDHTGRVFGKLTVVSRVPGTRPIKWECLCECGEIAIVLAGNLTKKTKPTQSCGCLKTKPPSSLSHGLSRHRVNMIYHNMVQRTTNQNSPLWPYYGGRPGCPITTCDRWLESDGLGFLNFIEDMGIPEDGMTIERIDNSKGYSKSNCAWKTMHAQSRNKRSNRPLTRPSDGKTMIMADWAAFLGVHRSQIGRRLEAGWTMEEALTIKNSPAQRDPVTGEFVSI